MAVAKPKLCHPPEGHTYTHRDLLKQIMRCASEQQMPSGKITRTFGQHDITLLSNDFATTIGG